MKTMALIAVALLTACGADAPTPVSPAVPAARPSHAPQARQAPPAPRIDITALASHSLAVNSLPQMRLLATAEGRGVLARIVSCALPAGASITAINSSGTPYSFTGATGLAADWAQRAPTVEQHRRVTACVGEQAGAFRV